MGADFKAILNLVWFAVAVLSCAAPLLVALILKRLFASVTFLKYVGYFFTAVSFALVCFVIRSLLIPLEDKTITYEVIGIIGGTVCLVMAALVINSLLLKGGNGKETHEADDPHVETSTFSGEG